MLYHDHANNPTSDSKTLRSNNIHLGFPSPLVPGSSTHINILSEWVRSCDNTRHLPYCKSFIPTRLLEVGDVKVGRVRLICNLAESLTSVKYVALSHRWGTLNTEQPAEGKFVTTTRKNIGLITTSGGIKDTDLPQTFQDAVAVTRSLNLKYLWIDSLCILQADGEGNDPESKEDWDRESKLMEEVFGSAYLAIAASCAQHKFQGFLKPRTSRQIVTISASDGAQFHVCEVIDKFESDVEQGELNQRGWVLQERALSRRTIHFTETQTYWECGGGIRCETFTKTAKLVQLITYNEASYCLQQAC